MRYKKVFSKTRFQTKNRNSFHIDQKTRSVLVGKRSDGPCEAFLGKVIEHGKVSSVLDYSVLCDLGFPHVVGVFGSRGSGKSFDLGVFLEELFGAGGGPGVDDSAAVVFDVQDQFWTLAWSPDQQVSSDASQIRDLKRWGLEEKKVASLSVFIPRSSDTPVPDAVPFALAADQISEADLLGILELERFSPMGQALVSLLAAKGNKTPEQLAKSCRNDGPLANFQQGTIDGLRWRLESLAKTRIVADQGISAEQLLRPGSLSVILMRNLPDSIRALVVGVIARLVADRMGRVQQSRRVARRTGETKDAIGTEQLAKRLWMILDEAHVLVPSDGTTAATSPLIDYVKRGRDAGLSLIFATQQPSAVNTKLMSQVDMTFTHTLGFEADVTAAVNRMPTRTAIEYDVADERAPSIGDVIRSLAPGEAVLADGSSGRAFLVKVRPRCTAHGGDTPT